MKTISGEWSIKTTDDVVVERLSEKAAWDYLLHQTIDPNAKLLYRDKVMARYHSSSPPRHPDVRPIEPSHEVQCKEQAPCSDRWDVRPIESRQEDVQYKESI